jgi:tetratricopeptide (TPR) repeat protein
MRFIVAIITFQCCIGCGEAKEKISSTLVNDSKANYGQGTIENDSYYKSILKNYPENDVAWRSRSVAYNKRGKLEQGIHMLNEAVRLRPHAHIGYRGYVKLYMMHDYVGALNDFHTLLDISNEKNPVAWGENAYKMIGLIHLYDSNYDSAGIYLDRSILLTTEEFSIDYVDSRCFLYKAYALLGQNRLEEATEILETTLTIENRFPEAHYLKAKLYHMLAKNRQALMSIQQAENIFQKYGGATNGYFEMPYQLYASQIECLKKTIEESLNRL